MGHLSTHDLKEKQDNRELAERILRETYQAHSQSGKPFNVVNGTQWQIDAMEQYAQKFKEETDNLRLANQVLTMGINLAKSELQQYRFGSFGEGGRNMLRLIIDTIKAKKEATEDGIERGLTKEIDFLSGRQSAFRELLNIMERDLKLLEGK